MKYVFDFTKVKDKIAVVSLLKDVLQISLSKAKETFDKSKVTLDSTKYPLIDRYLDNFKHADENIIITEFKETVRSYKPFTLKEENNTQNTPLERAKQVVYCHSDLTQEKRVLATLNSIRFNYFSTMKYKFKSILKRIFRSNN